MSLGTRLKKERRKRNWSQVDVANRVGITNAVLSNYERDVRDPDTTTLKKLADLYEVSTDFLIQGSDYNDSSKRVEKEFQQVITDPDLKRWYSELPNPMKKTCESCIKCGKSLKTRTNETHFKICDCRIDLIFSIRIG